MNNNITWQQIEKFVWLGGLLLPVLFAWFTISNQLSLTNQRLDTVISNNSDMKNDIGNIKDKQQTMAIDIAKIQQTLELAKNKGEISQIKENGYIASLIPSISPLKQSDTSATLENGKEPVTTNNYYSIDNSSKKDSNKEVTPTPTQVIKQPEPTPKQPLLNLTPILGLLGIN